MKTNYEIMKKIIRDQRLEREEQNGRPRAKSWSGKPTSKDDRRSWKREARSID